MKNNQSNVSETHLYSWNQKIGVIFEEMNTESKMCSNIYYPEYKKNPIHTDNTDQLVIGLHRNIFV